MRYVAIVLFTLLTLSWRPSHAKALPGRQPERLLRQPHQNLTRMPPANTTWAMALPLLSSYLLQTRNLRPRRVAKSCKEWWS